MVTVAWTGVGWRQWREWTDWAVLAGCPTKAGFLSLRWSPPSPGVVVVPVVVKISSFRFPLQWSGIGQASRSRFQERPLGDQEEPEAPT